VRKTLRTRALVGTWLLALGVLVLSAGPAPCQNPPVTGQVEMGRHSREKPGMSGNDDEVVVWLKAVESEPPPSDSGAAKREKLVQHHKTFEPHVLVVPVGSVVEFPNKDPFFHNVFSLFEGKRFDLGLYEAGVTNSVRFDREGVSYLFCNIHPEMSAVVVSVSTPYYGISDRHGRVSIPNVPDGRYEVHYWAERALPEALRKLTRVVTVSGSTRALGSVQIAENPNFSGLHKNKYGQDYVPPPPSDYSRP
jgi:plastocyanin